MVVTASTQNNTTCANVSTSNDNDAIPTATTALVQVCLQNITKCMLTGIGVDHLPREEIATSGTVTFESYMTSATSMLEFTVSSPSLSTSASPARNCDDIYDDISHSEGLYVIFTGENFIQVYCEFQPDGNNWLVS